LGKVNFNLNKYVYVNLTEHGERLLDGYEEEMKRKSKGREFKERYNKGFYRFQMWEFMKIFGDKVYNGAKNITEYNVIFLEEKDFGSVLKEDQIEQNPW